MRNTIQDGRNTMELQANHERGHQLQQFESFSISNIINEVEPILYGIPIICYTIDCPTSILQRALNERT